MKYFRVAKNEKFQHYGKPRPAWVKLYTKINDHKPSNDWRPLLDHELGQLVRIVAHAALNDNTLLYNAEFIQDVLHCDQPIDLDKFAKLGVITVFDSYEECLSIEKSRVLSRENTTRPSSEIRDQSSEVRGQRKKKEGNPPVSFASELQMKTIKTMAAERSMIFADVLKSLGMDRILASDVTMVMHHIKQTKVINAESESTNARNASLRLLKDQVDVVYQRGGGAAARVWIGDQAKAYQTPLSIYLKEMQAEHG